MRRRLLVSTLAAVGVALVLLGVPLAVAERGVLTRQALDELQREAERAQVLLNRQALTPPEQAFLLELLAREGGIRLTLLDATGSQVVRIDTGGPPALPGGLDSDVGPALRGEVGRAAGDGVLAVSVPVRAGDVRQVLRAVRDDRALRVEVRAAWMAIAGLAVTALGVGALVAGWQGRRLAKPLEDLAASARRLGDGDFSARAPRSGLPELDDVAAALHTTADRLGAALERSRSLGADASHQLRTPLTALRLDLEALQASGAERALTAAAIAEADRLEATIDELLALAEPPAGAELVDLVALAAERLDAWQALARAQGRQVVLQAAPVPAVRARAAALGQSLQVLLDNALEHGAGTITVSVQPVTGGARLCVADEGPGLSDPAVAALLERRGRTIQADPGDRDGQKEAAVQRASGAAGVPSGRGLPLARSLVEAEGGRLRLERARPGAMLCLVLPAPHSADGDGGPLRR